MPTVKELQQLLRAKGLKVSGRKSDLIARLAEVPVIRPNVGKTISASSKRCVYDPSLFETDDPIEWENAYQETMDPKYKKETRNFSKTFAGKRQDKEPPIFLIPRERGGSSYKKNNLEGCASEDVMYAPISKGYSMQDVSSFTIGPVVGEGLCLVNAAFSKSICIMHMEGGGKFDLTKKNFWKKSSRDPERAVRFYNYTSIVVDGKKVETNKWLAENTDLWFSEWDKWRKAVALCSMGDFHWDDTSPCISHFSPILKIKSAFYKR